jgi:hypothetical protein
MRVTVIKMGSTSIEANAGSGVAAPVAAQRNRLGAIGDNILSSRD